MLRLFHTFLTFTHLNPDPALIARFSPPLVQVNQSLLDVATTVWDKIPSRIFFWSFNFLGTFIILQFLVAIVVDVLKVRVHATPNRPEVS